MFDRVDEWLMSMLTEYTGVEFVDVMRGDVKLPGEAKAAEDKDEADKESEEQHPLTERISGVLLSRWKIYVHPSVSPSRPSVWSWPITPWACRCAG